jgi:uncharacterized protein (DUF2062 family)
MPYKKLVEPFVNLLKQGITPEKLALTIALGMILGVTPVIGSTTALCTLAAVALRLNLPAIQLVNGVVYPLQFVLLIPYYRLGAWMFGADASSISLGGVLELIKTGVLHAIQTLWVVTVHALAGWLLTGALAVFLLYLALVPLLKLLWRRVANPAVDPA